MNSQTALRATQINRPRGAVALLGYGLVVVSGTSLLLALQGSAAFLPLLGLPVFMFAFLYPRSIYLPALGLFLGASLIVALQRENHVPLTITVLVVGGASLGLVLETTHALTIGRQKTEDVLERRNRELAALNSVAAAISSTLDLDQVLQRLVETADALLAQVTVVTFQRLDRQANTLHTIAASSSAPTFGQQIAFRPGEGIAGQALVQGRTIVVGDVSRDPHFKPGLEPPQYRSLLVVPIQIDDAVWGTLSVAARESDAFHEWEQQLMERLAQHAAIAIANSRLFDRVRTAEAQYRSLFQNNTDPIAVLDEQGQLLDANPAARRLLKIDADDAGGPQGMDVILGEPERFRHFVERATCGEIVRYEFTANMDGTTRHFEARVEQIPFSFGSALQWAAHDMSALRELDHWREELTDIIVHNLRNPLTWVKSGVGMAQLLLQQTRDPDVDAALANAEKGIARLEQQIDILLNIGRAEAGHDLTDRQPLSVTDVIQEVRELLGPRAAARRITLRTELNASLPKIDGNRNMLTWALQNLVDNAIKFSPTQAVVTIQALLEAGETETTGDRLRINVIDQGPGVPKADRQRVFQKFYQSNRPQGAKGVGLGLYFCRLAIEAHGGRIWIVDANDEPGATFCFTLPV